MTLPEYIHYISIASIVGISGIGGCLGEGRAGWGGLAALERQPGIAQELGRALFMGLVLIETGPVIALVIALVLLFQQPPATLGQALGELGIATAICSTTMAMCIASGNAVRSALESMARQPFILKKIFTFMLLAQAIIEAPVIFAFILAVLINIKHFDTCSLLVGYQMFASGLALGIGAIGPSIGQAFLAGAAGKALGLREEMYERIFSLTLINQTLIDTPLIFSLLFAFLILYAPLTPESSISSGIAFIMAACAMGGGALGAGSAMGYVSSRSIMQITESPEHQRLIARPLWLSIAFIESSVIYAMIIGLLLIRSA